MGLFSSICSGISGALEAVGSGIKNICSTIGGALFSGKNGIGAFAEKLLKPIISLPVTIALGPMIKTICFIISTIAEILNIKTEDEKPEELALKAEKSDKKPEDFDSVEKYIEHIRSEIEVDPSEVENLSEEDRLKYQIVGTALYNKALEEKYSMDLSPEYWQTAALLKLSPTESKSFIESFKSHGLNNMDDMRSYLASEKLSEGTTPSDVSNAIMDGLHDINPNMNEEELSGELLDMQIRV